MNIKSIIRSIAYRIISQPKARVQVSLTQVNYNQILKNKTIVITGGSKGIGFAMAQKFVFEGARVLITGRNEDDLIQSIAQLGNNAEYLSFDISKTESLDSFVENCFSKLGEIDAMVLNAGISLHEGSFMNVTQEGYDIQFDTNLKANYFIAQAFLKKKLTNETGGNLLFLSSETAGKCIDIPYGLTKAAINSLVGGLARRVYQRGIRVNAIAPGVTLTNMTRGNNKIDTDDLGKDSVAGRWLLPEEIAEVAAFLISDASKCINGEVIYCDAGSHLKINGTESEYSF